MQNIVSLPELFKRDTKGKIRTLTIQYGYDTDPESNETMAGIRSISGITDGKKITSIWNISEPTNVGRSNARNVLEQAKFEAQAEWDKKSAKEYFINIADIDSYEIFKPMLAHDYTKRPQSSGYSQPKLDGIRCIVDKNGMWTRGGKPITSCPHVWKSLEKFITENPNLVIDGELYNHELKADFNKITSLVRKLKSTPADMEEAAQLVQYHVYDCFDNNNPSSKFTDRVKVLKSLRSDIIRPVMTDYCETQEELDACYSSYTEDGYEGQMVRNDAPYECKRSKNLLKRKEFITEEFKVIEVIEGQGAWSGYAKRFILALPDGTEFGSGVRGTQAQLKELLETKEKPDWATCRFFELTPDGIPRFPVVVDYGTGVRED